MTENPTEESFAESSAGFIFCTKILDQFIDELNIPYRKSPIKM